MPSGVAFRQSARCPGLLGPLEVAAALHLRDARLEFIEIRGLRQITLDRDRVPQVRTACVQAEEQREHRAQRLRATFSERRRHETGFVGWRWDDGGPVR